MDVRRILCPVDFSENSRRAVEYAIVLARAFAAKLTVMHAFLPDVTFGSLATVDAEQELRRQQRQLEEQYPLEPEIDMQYLVKSGMAAEGIVESAKAGDVDLIVLGTHGRTGLRRVLMGSVAEAVIREAGCPVLAIKADEDRTLLADDPAEAPLGGIVCAVDANDVEQDVVDVAASLAVAANVPLDLVHVTIFPDIAERPGCYGSPSDLIRDHAALKEVKPAIDVHVNYHHLSGSPTEKVVQFVEQQRPRLLVLGTHARRGIRRLLGSTASRILRKADCPVLVLRQHDASEDDADEDGSSPACTESSASPAVLKQDSELATCGASCKHSTCSEGCQK